MIYPRLVGPTQYRRLFAAIEFYERMGFQPIDVPWAVSEETLNMTRPLQAGPGVMTYLTGGFELCPVASAEQSFLQLQLDAKERGESITGSYVTMTPCFRNEQVLSDLHQPYFMKVELISWDRADHAGLNHMLSCAAEFFDNYVSTDEVENHDHDPLGVAQTIDIIAKRSGIELGSYGIRHHDKVGRWLYGTGIAEPRLSYAIEVENGLTKKASF